MDFELRELQYFVAVAEELHFGRAAERVGIEQSPLSKAITVMEGNMGVQLFVRTRKSTRLTPVGQALLEDARRILGDVDLVQRKIAATAAKGEGKLRIGISSTLATPRVGRLLSQCRAEEPDLNLSLVQRTRHELRRELHAGLLDIALVSGLNRPGFPGGSNL